jgi:septal ring factor EnvC (AmiA/AmiB activator)
MKSEKNPITQEAVERWQQGKINIFDEMARLEDRLRLLEEENKNLIEAIKKFHKTKNRYDSQIACAKMFELVGLPAQYPDNYERK